MSPDNQNFSEGLEGIAEREGLSRERTVALHQRQLAGGNCSLEPVPCSKAAISQVSQEGHCGVHAGGDRNHGPSRASLDVARLQHEIGHPAVQKHVPDSCVSRRNHASAAGMQTRRSLCHDGPDLWHVLLELKERLQSLHLGCSGIIALVVDVGWDVQHSLLDPTQVPSLHSASIAAIL